MGSPDVPDGGRRQERRVVLDRPIAVRYRLFQNFVEAVSSNISPGGMFVRSRQPRPPGSKFDFEFKLADGFSLIKGHGEVAWVRPEAEDEGRPAGMGVRFVRLDPKGEAIVRQLVSDDAEKGRPVFDLEREAPAPKPAAPAAPPRTPPPTSPARAPAPAPAAEAVAPPDSPPAAPRPALELTPEGGATVARRTRKPLPGPVRLLGLVLVSALIGALVVVLFYQFFIRPTILTLEQRVEQLSAATGRPEPEPAVLEPPPAAPLPEAEIELPDPRDTVRAWARAWSERRVDDYLASYAGGFEPPLAMSRPQWEAARRVRIERPRSIKVGVALLEVDETGPASRRVSFVQSYESETYKDVVRKTLDLVWEDGAWRIARETVIR